MKLSYYYISIEDTQYLHKHLYSAGASLHIPCLFLLPPCMTSTEVFVWMSVLIHKSICMKNEKISGSERERERTSQIQFTLKYRSLSRIFNTEFINKGKNVLILKKRIKCYCHIDHLL